MSEKKLGVLIQGAGWVSTQHIKAFQTNPHTEIVAISSRRMESCKMRADEAGCENVTFYTDYEKALKHEGIDIVSVCTPQHFHAEHAIMAAEAGKNIVIEKPIANSVEEMKAMREAVHKAGVKTIVSFVLRWNPLFTIIKRMMADNALGDLYYAETDYQSNISSWWSGFEYASKKNTGVSAFLVGGCHAIDALRWFSAKGEYESAKPVEVFAYSGGWRKGSDTEYDYYKNIWQKGKPVLEYDGLEVALVKFDNGVMGKVSVNFDSIMPYTFPIEIFGDKGSIKNNRVWSHKFPGQKNWVEIPTLLPDTADVNHHPFQGEMDHFVECIIAGKESHANLDDAIMTHEIAFAALKCYETKQPVKLPLI
jgi:predicted dehydrogenase